MRIGELAVRVGVSADMVRYYEREAVLPQPERCENGYREYDEADTQDLRLLIDLRSPDAPLPEAAAVATLCHSGHCTETTVELPRLIFCQRTMIAERIERLQAQHARRADLGGHMDASGGLSLIEPGTCCDAAAAVLTAGQARCVCCAQDE